MIKCGYAKESNCNKIYCCVECKEKMKCKKACENMSADCQDAYEEYGKAES